jgi:type VI secretion system secreted protein VgrG
MKLKLAILLFMALAYGPAPAAAQILGSAQSFAVLGSATVTNTGATIILGNVGVSPGTSITGFPPGILKSGTIYTGVNAVVVQAQADAQTGYNALVAKPCTTNLSGTDLGGLTLTPGVYCFDVAAMLTAGNATLTLDAQNGPGVFVFKIGTTLTTGTSSAVNVINGNAATAVFWQLGSSATLGTGTLFAGNILANASITVVSTAKILCGRALALNGAVTMDTNTISNNCTSDNFGTGRTDFGSLGFAGASTHATLATHDFNGDAKSDILWRSTGGDVAMWLMDGTTIAASAGLGNVLNNWSIVGQRDFNGDGKADILWTDTSGDVAIWFQNGTTTSSGAIVATGVPPNWMIVGTGDFNGDGKGDILWRDTSGNVAIWFMNGSTISSTASLGNVPTNWTIVGTGDFNGDGKGDILWRDTSGNVAIWFMNGTQVLPSSAVVANAPANWTIVGTGDFNGDAKSDILWRSTGGDVAMWLMNGTTIAAGAGLGNVPNVWSVVQTGDYYGAGTSDILWRNTGGDLGIWKMNGATIVSTAGLGNVPTVWSVQSTNAE